MAIEYPKIETLYNRGADFNVDTTQLRDPLFGNVSRWLVTEKIDGTNIRIGLNPDGSVWYNGRTDNAQMNGQLVQYLHSQFPTDKLQAAFERNEDGTWPEVILFGEGYGAGIQKGGSYRPDKSFILFDVLVGRWWMEWEDVVDISKKIGCQHVPDVCELYGLPENPKGWLDTIMPNSVLALWNSGLRSPAEGVVARAHPMLYNKFGQRLMWKLKFSDFNKGKK